MRLWLYRLQQHLSITRRESLAILSVLALFLIGLAVQEVRRRATPPRPAASRLIATSDSLQASEALPASTEADTGMDPGADARAEAEPEEGAEQGGRIDLNAASETALQALPGIGPALAGRIARYRARRPFADVNELERVSGIGPKTLARLRPLVHIGKSGAHEGEHRSDSTSALSLQ